MTRDMAYWQKRARNLRRTILTETNMELLENACEDYMRCLCQISTIRAEIEKYTYVLN